MQVDRGREKPAEGLRVISVTAVLGICIYRLEQLLSVHEVQEREGGREERQERKREQNRDKL